MGIKLMVIAGIITLGLTACGGSTNNETITKQVVAPVVDQAKVKAEADSKAADEAKKKAEQDAAEAKAKAEDAAKKLADESKAKEAIKKYMLDNFGGGGDPKFQTSWYGNITDYEMHKSGDKYTAVVRTSLFPKDTNKQVAKNIMAAVTSWSNEEFKLWGITVYGSDNLPLSSK